MRAVRRAAGKARLRPIGVHCHLGSMISDPAPFERSAALLSGFFNDCRRQGIGLEHINIGGGLGIDYRAVLHEHGDPFLLPPERLAEKVIPLVRGTGALLLLEPGRAVVAQGGALITTVLYVKNRGGKTFVIVDAGMNDLIRPVLYNAHHEIIPLHRRAEEKSLHADIVGPLCESGDFFARDRLLPPLRRGDRLAIMTAGAYGYVQSSNYNARPRAAEVWVDGDRVEVIRERESLYS